MGVDDGVAWWVGVLNLLLVACCVLCFFFFWLCYCFMIVLRFCCAALLCGVVFRSGCVSVVRCLSFGHAPAGVSRCVVAMFYVKYFSLLLRCVSVVSSSRLASSRTHTQRGYI